MLRAKSKSEFAKYDSLAERSKAPFRKGVGSNPTAVTHVISYLLRNNKQQTLGNLAKVRKSSRNFAKSRKSSQTFAKVRKVRKKSQSSQKVANVRKRSQTFAKIRKVRKNKSSQKFTKVLNKVAKICKSSFPNVSERRNLVFGARHAILLLTSRRAPQAPAL